MITFFMLISQMALYLLFGSLGIKASSFWDEEVQVDIKALRPQNYLRCSYETLLELREAVLNPEYSKVKDHSSGIVDIIRGEWKEWTVISASRNFVLPTQPVHVSSLLHIRCENDKGCSSFLFMIPYHEAIQSNGIKAMTLPGKEVLDITVIKDANKAPVNCIWETFIFDGVEVLGNYDMPKCKLSCYPAFYSISLTRHILKGMSIRVRVDHYLGKPYVPLQKGLALGKQQRVTFGTSSLFQCPYHTVVQRTYFSLMEELKIDIISLHAYASLTEIKPNVFICGPFEKVEFLSFGEEIVLAVDFHDSLEFAPVVERLVWVPVLSLRGYTVIRENYVVYNDASPIEGHFSQATIRDLEVKHSENDTSINHVSYMEALFPVDAKNLMYYDVIGNISRVYRSKTSPLPDYKMFDLLPRYPLLGGWKTTFTAEYSHPSSSDLKSRSNSKQKGNWSYPMSVLFAAVEVLCDFRTYFWTLLYQIYGGEAVVKVPLCPSIFYMYIQEARLTVELPPGSRVTNVVVPSYCVYKLDSRRRKMLGTTVLVNQVLVDTSRLSLHSLDAFVDEVVEVYYIRNWLWALKVMASVVLHTAFCYAVFKMYKWLERWYKSLCLPF